MSDKEYRELENLIEEGDAIRAQGFLDRLPSEQVPRAFAQLSKTFQEQLLQSLDPENAAIIVEQIADAHAAEIVNRIPAESAAAIVHELPSNEGADLISELSDQQVNAIYEALEDSEESDLKKLVEYPEHVAGGLMVTEMLAYSDDWNVDQILNDIRVNREHYRKFEIQYLFVVDHAGKLLGVLQGRDLLLARPEQTLKSLMIANPESVKDSTPLDELRAFFDQHHFFGVPVVDADQKLLGVLSRVAVEEALGDRAGRDYLRTQGIVREELRSMPTSLRSRRRLAWLSINIVLNLAAAGIIAMFQETLAQVIALAVFLPIISDMSGCSGNQAIAVSMRELSLGVIQPRDTFRVWLKEISVGVIIGIVLGSLVGLLALFWQGNPYLGLIVGVALATNTLVAVSIGGTLPLVIKRFGMDPALASGPVLTTATDMCGFFLMLSLASAMLPLLV